MSSTFSSLGLSAWLQDALRALNIDAPSEIQRECAAPILQRRDVFACARTGSGKTLAFVLPVMQLLQQDPRPYFALVLAPTRELAQQIHALFQLLAARVQLKTQLVIGGGRFGSGDESDGGLWVGKPNVVVGTPGRVLDMFTQCNYLDLCGSRASFDVLVLDEADQLISRGFCDQLGRIIRFVDSHARRRRQTLVFSATLTPALAHLQSILTGSASPPVQINLIGEEEAQTPVDLEQRFVLCPEDLKSAYLVQLLLSLPFRQTIVFCASKKEARLVHRVLLNVGLNEPPLAPVLLNADLEQTLRFAAVDKFKSLRSRILVTTDLASRGLDLPQVDLVLNYTCPASSTVYVHRVGRTCRKPLEQQGKKKRGKAVTLVTQFDVQRVQSIEEAVGVRLEREEVAEEEVRGLVRSVALAQKELE